VRLFPKGRYPNKQHERGGGGRRKMSHITKRKTKKKFFLKKKSYVLGRKVEYGNQRLGI
jgi:hypothetical protein